MSSIIAVGYLNSNGKLTNYNCLTTHQTQRLKIWIIRNWQSKTYTEDANRIPRSHYHKYFKNCQRDASPVLCRSLVEKDLFSLCLVIEGFWIIFLVKKFTIVFLKCSQHWKIMSLLLQLPWSTLFASWPVWNNWIEIILKLSGNVWKLCVLLMEMCRNMSLLLINPPLWLLGRLH